MSRMVPIGRAQGRVVPWVKPLAGPGLVVEVADGGIVLPGPLRIAEAAPVARFSEDLLNDVQRHRPGSMHCWLYPFMEVTQPDRCKPTLRDWLAAGDPCPVELRVIWEPGTNTARVDEWSGGLLKVRLPGDQLPGRPGMGGQVARLTPPPAPPPAPDLNIICWIEDPHHGPGRERRWYCNRLVWWRPCPHRKARTPMNSEDEDDVPVQDATPQVILAEDPPGWNPWTERGYELIAGGL